MPDFDLFHVKLSGISDTGQIHAEVKIGFWDDRQNEHSAIVVPVYMKADLDASLREVREQAKAAALELIKKASHLLEQHSTDELHQAGIDQAAKHNAEIERKAISDMSVVR